MRYLVVARWLPLFVMCAPLSCSISAASTPICDVRWRVGETFSLILAIAVVLSFRFIVFFFIHLHTCAKWDTLTAFCHTTGAVYFSLFWFFLLLYLFPVCKHFLQFYFCHVDYYLMQFQTSSIHAKMHFVFSANATFTFWNVEKEKKTFKICCELFFLFLLAKFTRERKREINSARKILHFFFLLRIFNLCCLINLHFRLELFNSCGENSICFNLIKYEMHTTFETLLDSWHSTQIVCSC